MTFFSALSISPIHYDATHHVGVEHSTIDYICARELHNVQAEQIYCPNVSQHDLLLATFAITVPTYVAKPIRFRDFKNVNWDNFGADLNSIDWASVAHLPDVDRMVMALTATMTQLFDTHAPYKTIIPKKSGKPWFNDDLRAIIRERNRAWRRHRRLGRHADLMEFRRLRNHLRIATRNARAAYYKDKLANCNASSAWRIIGRLGVGSRDRETFALPVDVDVLNANFIGDADRAALPNLCCDARVAPEKRFFFSSVEALDVLGAFRCAHSNARGVDDLSLKQLQLCLPELLPIICEIFNASLQSGIFPALWKEAVVRPLPKRFPPLDAGHLRPISMLCAISKIFEHVALRQMSRFIEDRGFLDDFQSGFRKSHSTHTALVRIVDDIREAIDNKEVTVMVAIDFSRAFDTVDVDLLLSKLCIYQFSDAACCWLRSYLVGRAQHVISPQGQRSRSLTRARGVPQGSLCGPFLFSLFINDLPSVCHNSKYHLYADDFTIYARGPAAEAETIIRKVNEDLARISTWANNNGLTINVKKTQAAWFGARRLVGRLATMTLPALELDGEAIELCEWIKILGIKLDATLSWREQTTDTTRKCFATLARLRRLRDHFPRATRSMLVRSLMFPHLDYGAGIFIGLSAVSTSRLERCLNAALRFITGARKSDHITPVYSELGVLRYARRRDYVILCLLAAILHRGEPIYIARSLRFFAPGTGGSRRRSELDLVVPRARTDCFINAFTIHAARLWNNLPESVRVFYKNPAFKSVLRSFFISM